MTVAAPGPVFARPSVLVVSANAGTRAGIRLALEPGVDCYDARTVPEAVGIAAAVFPTVCIVSADADAEATMIRELAAAMPHARIVVLTHEVRDDRLLAAVHAGAVGYLSERVDPDRLPFVVRGVMRGEAAIPRLLVSRLVDELRERRRRRQVLTQARGSVELTTREWEVLELLRRGGTTKEIARALSIADVTVRRHVGALLRKLEVENRQEAVALLADADEPRSTSV